jgi:hypothetical protein
VGRYRRYLAFLSALDDFSAGVRVLNRVTRPRRVQGKTVKGVNFFDRTEQRLPRLRSARPSISPASAAPSSCRSSTSSPRLRYRARLPAYTTSA